MLVCSVEPAGPSRYHVQVAFTLSVADPQRATGRPRERLDQLAGALDDTEDCPRLITITTTAESMVPCDGAVFLFP